MRATTPSYRRPLVLLTALTVAGLGLAACGDDGDDTSSAGVTTTEQAAPAPDPAIAENVAVATDLCEAYGELEEPGAVDELLSLMTEDVVVTDTVLGASLTGTDQVRDYVTSDAFEGIDTADCGAAVGRAAWVAGTYTLGNSNTGEAGQGVSAIHVVNGKVDQQITYYSSVADGTAPAPETVSDPVILDYCHAWDDGAEADEVLSLMAAEPELQIVTPLVGTDAITAFIENDFDFDRNDCDDVAVVHGDWGATASSFENSTTGAVAEGVSVVLVDDDGLIVKHFVHMEAPAA